MEITEGVSLNRQVLLATSLGTIRQRLAEMENCKTRAKLALALQACAELGWLSKFVRHEPKILLFVLNPSLRPQRR